MNKELHCVNYLQQIYRKQRFKKLRLESITDSFYAHINCIYRLCQTCLSMYKQ